MASVAEDIANALKDLVSALPGYTFPVVVRDLPDVADGDPDDVVVVSVEDDEPTGMSFEHDSVEYTCSVVLATKTGGRMAGAGGNRAWKQACRRALRLPTLAAVPAVYHSEVLKTPPAPRDGQKANRYYTRVLVKYRAVEPRG